MSKRLAQDREVVYSDRSFSADPREMREELLDVCARSFILHERLRRLEDAVGQEAASTETQGQLNDASQDVENELSQDHSLAIIGRELDQVAQAGDSTPHVRDDTTTTGSEEA